ncbi:GOLPH3/VPS74 family protein [Pseudonocardia phyllosphaerae]|uniref:GOLPH3/VPS74 family protein n=1 Tax=Pseudonocardia phyllosphaerae TaxID=3390502 RepID=UPI00397E88B8
MRHGDLATGFYLVAFDEAAGRPGLHPGLLACGVVGAELADLIADGALTVTEAGAVERTGRAPADRADDESAVLVLDSVAHEPRAHPVRAWIDALGPPVLEAVENRLVRDGVLASRRQRGLFGRGRPRLDVTDPVTVHAPVAALREMVRLPGTFTLHGAWTLVELGALGVEQLLEPDVDRATARSVAAEAAAHLPAPLNRLRTGLAETAAAVSLTVQR